MADVHDAGDETDSRSVIPSAEDVIDDFISSGAATLNHLQNSSDFAVLDEDLKDRVLTGARTAIVGVANSLDGTNRTYGRVALPVATALPYILCCIAATFWIWLASESTSEFNWGSALFKSFMVLGTIGLIAMLTSTVTFGLRQWWQGRNQAFLIVSLIQMAMLIAVVSAAILIIPDQVKYGVLRSSYEVYLYTGAFYLAFAVVASRLATRLAQLIHRPKATHLVVQQLLAAYTALEINGAESRRTFFGVRLRSALLAVDFLEGAANGAEKYFSFLAPRRLVHNRTSLRATGLRIAATLRQISNELLAAGITQKAKADTFAALVATASGNWEKVALVDAPPLVRRLSDVVVQRGLPIAVYAVGGLLVARYLPAPWMQSLQAACLAGALYAITSPSESFTKAREGFLKPLTAGS